MANGVDFDALPPPLQRTILKRDAAIKPFHPAIESLDVSWTIVNGNLRELVAVMDVFDTDDQAKAVRLWSEPPHVKHRYHLETVRLFHNVLSATVANLEHSTRAALLFRRLAVETFGVACERDRKVRNRLAFLIAIHDFSIHRGAHASVLMLKGTEAGTFCGRVGFAVARMLAEQNAKLASARSRNDKASANLAIERLQAAGNSVEIRPLVTDYYKHLKEYRDWLRNELVNVWSRQSADLERWASEDDRPAVIQYYIDNPILVFRPAEE